MLAFTGLLTLSNASFVTKPGEIGDNETTINNKTSWKTILWKQLLASHVKPEDIWGGVWQCPGWSLVLHRIKVH